MKEIVECETCEKRIDKKDAHGSFEECRIRGAYKYYYCSVKCMNDDDAKERPAEEEAKEPTAAMIGTKLAPLDALIFVVILLLALLVIVLAVEGGL